ncbi:hypothetical protein GQ457_04G038830 [Hibiscus cannabinus]
MWKPISCSTIATWRIMKEFLEQRSQVRNKTMPLPWDTMHLLKVRGGRELNCFVWEEDWLSLELVQMLWGREVNALAVKLEKCTGEEEEHDFRVRFPQGKGIGA